MSPSLAGGVIAAAGSSGSSAAVHFEGVSKSYGSRLALSDLSFEVPRGAICALVGPNGAGKTTTMGLIGGLLRHERGRIDILGRGPFDARVHAGRIGLMPQDCVPSAHLNLRDILRYYASLQGLRGQTGYDEADRRLTQLELMDRAGSKYGQLSHGMRRRFSIAQALLGSPELILLDEPTSGLDPELVVHVRELLRSYAGSSTLLVSSHVLSELEALCDYVVFIDGGKCLRHGTLREVTGSENLVRYTLTSAPDLGRLEAALVGCRLEWRSDKAAPNGVTAGGCLSVQPPLAQAVEETNRLCLRALLEMGVGILGVHAGDSLERTYLRAKQLDAQP